MSGFPFSIRIPARFCFVYPFKNIIQAVMAATLIATAIQSLPAPAADAPTGIWEFWGESTSVSFEDCAKDLRKQAVHAAAGRFYMGDDRILARDLMAKYIDQYYENFVVAHHVLSQKQNGKNFFMAARVTVKPEALYEDLKDKLFIYSPKSNPLFYVFLNESINGQPVASASGRAVINQFIDANGLNRLKTDLPTPAPNTDLDASTEVMNQARQQAQIYEVELVVFGSMTARKVSETQLYFQNAVFYEVQMQLNLMRVDDGKILTTLDKTYRAAQPNDADALAAAIELATAESMKEFLAWYTSHWRKAIHGAAEYRLMLTHFDDKDVEVFINQLKAFHPSLRFFERNTYGGIAVYGFDYSGDTKILDAFMRKTLARQYQVKTLGEKKMEIVPIRY